MIVQLATCNQCGNVYEDLNIGDEMIDYSPELIRLFKIQQLQHMQMFDEDGLPEGWAFGCSKCQTDVYLQDNINGYAGGMATEISNYLKSLTC